MFLSSLTLTGRTRLFASFPSPEALGPGYFRQVPAGLIFSNHQRTCAILTASLKLTRMDSRRTTGPFSTQPSGRGRSAVFLRGSLLTYQSRYARRSPLEKQLTDPASAHGRQYKEETMVNEPEFCRRLQGGSFGNR